MKIRNGAGALKYVLSFIVIFFFLLKSVFAFLASDDLTLEKFFETKKIEGEVFLKYQSADGNYLLFYDLDGSIFLLRYRIDKWDYTNNKLRDFLRRGVTYRVEFKEFTRLAANELPPSIEGYGLPPATTKRKIRSIRQVYTGTLVHVAASALRDLRY
ncbi:MAG: hypothetical protein LDLANPLL_02483 [Turneriella sp.]|nr:hypothetical protein [Turneriella sp.]